MLYGKYDSRVRHQSAPSISERTFTDLCRDRGLSLASSTGIFPAHSASSILKTAQTPTARKYREPAVQEVVATRILRLRLVENNWGLLWGTGVALGKIVMPKEDEAGIWR